MSDRRGSGGDLWKIGAPVFAIVAVGFFLAYWFVDPAPPSRIVVATGEASGAYHAFGAEYRARLREFEIEVELRETAGSDESLELLRERKVDVAFVQGGVSDPADGEQLESLGSLYYEPLWVFVRAGSEAVRLSDLAGLRIAVGPEGSGTQAIALELLARNGIETRGFDLAGRAGVDALLTGQVDAAFLIASPTSELVRELLLDPRAQLFSFSRAEAYVRTHRFLSHVVLPEGMIDFARNIPDRRIDLVAPTANLVGHADLHPALVDLLVQSAAKIHGPGGVFESPGTFPTADFIELPLNSEAERYYKYGPPFLQRYLPFWLATLVDRLKVMLIPLVALLIPIFRLFPPIYRWRVRSRIYRWYTELREIDPRNRGDFGLEEAIAEVQRIENEVTEVEAPASYAQELYDLHLHVEFVKRQLEERRGAADS